MENEVRRYKTLNDELEENKKLLSSFKADFEEKHKMLISKIAELNDEIGKVKPVIEASALVIFRNDPEKKKKLFGGIGIRETTVIDYDESKAFAFAKEKDMFLQLDKKAFDKAAPALGLDFVKVTKKEQVTFPKEVVLS